VKNRKGIALVEILLVFLIFGVPIIVLLCATPANKIETIFKPQQAEIVLPLPLTDEEKLIRDRVVIAMIQGECNDAYITDKRLERYNRTAIRMIRMRRKLK